MTVEIINTGSELMLGRTLNTHQQWLCRRLSDLGYTVPRQISVADTARDIEKSIQESLSRADLIITTGGLGPTSDDVTRDSIARLLGKALREDAAVLARLKSFFTARKRVMPERTRIQALVPEGATILPNPNGTAPGLAMEIEPNPFRPDNQPAWLIMLPGPPRELKPMFNDFVVPLLARVRPVDSVFICRTLRTAGVPESLVEERIAKPLLALLKGGLDLGYCARVGEVDVRLSARGDSAVSLVAEAERIVRNELDADIYGVDDEEFETVIVRLLKERKQTLAVAESCTGGCIANRITNVPGASEVFLAGFVTYSNDTKKKFLDVRAETLAKHGAVSEVTAREMAEGARKQTGADFALSVTGVAGPGGGTTEKPAGTVFIGLAGSHGVSVERHFNPFDRETFKQVVTQQAFNQLRLLLK